MSLSVEIRKDGRIAILHLEGDLTVKDVKLLRESIRTQMKEGTDSFCIDLSALDRIDSAGFGELIRLYTSVRRVGSLARLWRMASKVREGIQKARLRNVSYSE